MRGFKMQKEGEREREYLYCHGTTISHLYLQYKRHQQYHYHQNHCFYHPLERITNRPLGRLYCLMLAMFVQVSLLVLCVLSCAVFVCFNFFFFLFFLLELFLNLSIYGLLLFVGFCFHI